MSNAWPLLTCNLITHIELSTGVAMDIGLRQLGKYQLREPLGRGGMAEVWKAFDTSLHRYVAIKMMHTNLQNDPEFVVRFEREARVVASLRHPNIVRLHDFQVASAPGFSSPVAYMVMEYIAGQTLTDYIRATSRAGNFPSLANIIHLFSPIASAIDYAHRAGMIHRDIKPANILLDPARPSRFHMGEPILTDFGIVKLMGASTVTLSGGGWIGTPLYISPEQAQGHAGDERSDIYALGVILYEICTGVSPFQGENPLAIIMQQINTMPMSPDLINSNLSPELTSVIMRSLAKNPEERFPSASALTAALIDALKPLPTPVLSSAMPVNPGRSVKTPVQPNAAIPDMQNKPPVSVETTFVQPPAPLPSLPRPASPGKKRVVISLLALLLLLLTGSGLGMFYALSHQKASPPLPGLVGHAYFVNSGLTQENYTQGINDQLQIELHNIPAPASGKTYYAWLLNDKNVQPQRTLLLGTLSVNQGNVKFLYPGDAQHSNLVGTMSRLLITEENVSVAPTHPSSDQATWHYYAELPQTPDATGIHQRTVDVVRDILFNTQRLRTPLPEGIDIHFLNNVQQLLAFATGVSNAWHSRDTVTLHADVVRILDYLDGVSLVKQDVPAGPSVLVAPPLGEVPLIDVVENQSLVSYIDRMNTDLTALFDRPDATANMRQFAVQADNAVFDNVKPWLVQVRQYAKQLVAMNSSQLLNPATLSVVNDMANQAANAYNGQRDPSNNHFQGGALWVHSHDQQLATFDITTYVVPST
jgi:serine/threonine protein kinase